MANIWAYNSRDFGSASAPFCADGTSTVGLLPDQIPWDRTLGFTDIRNLVAELDRALSAPARGETAVAPLDTLAILAHGLPDGIAVLPDGRVLNSAHYGAYGSALADLNRALHACSSANCGAPRQPTLILYACAAAARHRDTPAGTDSLIEWMSGWMENTRVVGFTRLLTLDGLRTVDLAERRFCLAPDVFETTEEYDYGRDIRAQGTADASAGRLPVASPDSISAIVYLNGRRVNSLGAAGASMADRPRRRGRARRD
ncbi:MAG: hypothetical protein R2762_09860 [Bryobacteraceae bacterium]